VPLTYLKLFNVHKKTSRPFLYYKNEEILELPHCIYMMPLVTSFINTYFIRIMLLVFFMEAFIRLRKKQFSLTKYCPKELYLDPTDRVKLL
jgi:hypothetical protein